MQLSEARRLTSYTTKSAGPRSGRGPQSTRSRVTRRGRSTCQLSRRTPRAIWAMCAPELLPEHDSRRSTEFVLCDLDLEGAREILGATSHELATYGPVFIEASNE